jgi:hypothetical protein
MSSAADELMSGGNRGIVARQEKTQVLQETLSLTQFQPGLAWDQTSIYEPQH